MTGRRVHPDVVATTCVVASAEIRALLDPWLGRSVPYLMYYPAVTIAAGYGGLGPGLLATFGAAILAVYRYLPALGDGTGQTAADLLRAVSPEICGSMSRRSTSCR
jgi:uncharacterized protein DUF4118